MDMTYMYMMNMNYIYTYHMYNIDHIYIHIHTLYIPQFTRDLQWISTVGFWSRFKHPHESV